MDYSMINRYIHILVVGSSTIFRIFDKSFKEGVDMLLGALDHPDNTPPTLTAPWDMTCIKFTERERKPKYFSYKI